MIAALVMIVFLYIICTIPFFIIGGGSTVDVIYLPLIFFSTLLTVQFAYSMAVIIQCALEEENG
jgi:hypothetical protein